MITYNLTKYMLILMGQQCKYKKKCACGFFWGLL